MNIQFPEIAPYLKEPLVLIGFFVFLAFSFSRFLIKNAIIPQLEGSLGFIILKLILLYGFIIGLILIFLGFFLRYKSMSEEDKKNVSSIVKDELDNKGISKKEEIALNYILKSSNNKYTKLKIVDAFVSDSLTVEIKLKNSGTDAAFLTDIRFVFYPGWGIANICMPVTFTLYEFPFTASLGKKTINIRANKNLINKEYYENLNRKLDTTKFDELNNSEDSMDEIDRPYAISQPLKISQAVPPGGVDRFKVRFNIDKKYIESISKQQRECAWLENYVTKAVIKYDGNKQIVSPQIELAYYP